ncbi:MAG TPA: hypothetical protein VEG30_11300 [Terriglobales bacterium]|nr:hypothetical protein [Terriglobales bacterium]
MLERLEEDAPLACPYFAPTERFDDAGWVHPQRLPLGAGFRGRCCAPEHDGSVPTDEALRSQCNLGYAHQCGWLPAERFADAVRFSIAQDRDHQIVICCVCERNYLPGGNSSLRYDTQRRYWPVSHHNPQIQRLAQCFLQVYLDRRAIGVEATQEREGSDETNELPG